MLKTMRKNVKSLKPVMWIVVATFVVAIFAIWGGAGRLGERNRSDTLVSIGQDKITSDDYYQALRSRLESIQKQFGGELNANLIQQLGVPQQTLEQLVSQRLLMKIAREMGLRASDAEVRAKIMSYPAFQQGGRFVGFEDYRRVLDYNRVPLADFERGLRSDVVMGKVVRVLTAGIFVTDDEVWQGYQKQNDTAKIEYLVAETAKSEAPAEPTEAELRAHFDKDPAAFRIPEKRSGDYVVLKTEDFKKEAAVEEAEIAKYYKDNPAQFQEPERVQVSRIWLPYTEADKEAVLARAREARSRAAGGGDFAALAREYSKDDKAAAGGDWGLYDWRSLSAPETEAVARLDKGGVSDVVETETGAAVLKVTDKAAAVTRPLSEVSPTIKGILEDQKARALVAGRIQRLGKTARKEKSLDFAAQKEGLRPASTGALKRGDPLGEFDGSGAVSEALFGLKEKEISAPVYTYAGEALVELKTIEPERPAAFEEARDEVAKALLEARKAERAQARLREAAARIKDDWSAEAARHQLEYKTVEAHKRDQYLSLVGDRPEIDALVFSLPLRKASEPVAVDGGYAVFRVLERTEAGREEFEKAKSTERETLVEEKRNKFLQSYLAQAREEKKVRISYDTFLRLTNDVLSRYQK
ncbi:MAG TPA: SurA N-terminal domain-containing protein [Candidatus Aminicenantes bacterium]|nr:SurA N-terminal domain-containing protein [Candidatus Aminicenantes bacterium]